MFSTGGDENNRAAARRSETALVFLLRRTWLYLSNAISIIGLISLLNDLTSWGIVIGGAMAWLMQHLPPLHELLNDFGNLIHIIIEAYRDFLYPKLRWLFQWLPIRIPGILIDLLTIFSLAMAGFLRERLRAPSRFRAEYQKFHHAFEQRVRADGFEFNREQEAEIFNELARELPDNSEQQARQEEKLRGLLGAKFTIYHAEFGPNAYRVAVESHRDPVREFQDHEFEYVRRWLQVSMVLCMILFLDFVFFGLPAME